MKKTNIKKQYSDALYWASSNKTKDFEYHIGRVIEAVLRKLIHYSKKNDKITYSNKIIAEHTFMGEETIRKAIQRLDKIGYLSNVSTRLSNKGEFKTRRTMYIQWDFISDVLSQVPKPEVSKEIAKEAAEDIPIKESTPVETNTDETAILATDLNHKDEVAITTSTADAKQLTTYSSNSTSTIPDIVITDEKLKCLKKISNNPELSIEEVESWGQDSLKNLFYGDNGIWTINDSSLENHYLIKYTHRGGSNFNLYNKNKINEQLELNIDDFNYYMEVRGIEFKDFRAKDYSTIKSYGLLKRPVLN